MPVSKSIGTFRMLSREITAGKDGQGAKCVLFHLSSSSVHLVYTRWRTSEFKHADHTCKLFDWCSSDIVDCTGHNVDPFQIVVVATFGFLLLIVLKPAVCFSRALLMK